MNGYFQVERGLLERMGADGNITAADFRVMMIAMRDTKLPGDKVALGIDYLAAGTDLDRSTIIRSRRHLIRLGYLVSAGFEQRGLACFTVAIGGMDATPGGVGATCRTDATGGVGATGTGGVDATCTGGVGATQMETGNIETTTYAPDDEKPPSRSAPHEGQNSAPKVTPKKQYPGDLDADAEKLVDLYAELVKPKRDDASGSHKIFLATAKRLLSEGKPFSELERSIRNYAASRKQREKRPDEVQFRWGFQTFFGPKNEHWRDFLAVDQESTAPASAGILPRDADPQWLHYHVEQVEKKHGEDMARRYDAIGRKRKSIEAADEWLKREIECRTA